MRPMIVAVALCLAVRLPAAAQAPDTMRVHTLAEVTDTPSMTNVGNVVRQLVRNYPPLLKDAGITGSAVVEVVVGWYGEPASITVLRASHPAFGQLAERTLQRARFSPARVRGTPVRVRLEIPMEFGKGGPSLRPDSAAAPP